MAFRPSQTKSAKAARLFAWTVAAALLVACGPSGPPVGQRTQPLYALGVASGECPPDVAFYHAASPSRRTELGVIAAPMQVVTYIVISDDPRYSGRSEAVTVAEGSNGHTFMIDIPMAAITAISVAATGAPGELASTCSAVPL